MKIKFKSFVETYFSRLHFFVVCSVYIIMFFLIFYIFAHASIIQISDCPLSITAHQKYTDDMHLHLQPTKRKVPGVFGIT